MPSTVELRAARRRARGMRNLVQFRLKTPTKAELRQLAAEVAQLAAVVEQEAAEARMAYILAMATTPAHVPDRQHGKAPHA